MPQDKKVNYGAEQIQVLEGLEAVRKRPGMYIGSTSLRGLHHLVYEVVDNSIDEALAGYCTHIEVTIEADNSITVVDNGRGIPVAMHKIGKPAVEVVLTVLHAGGKFGGDGYPISGGLHGVGISVVNALSLWTKVEVKRDGYLWNISFARGLTAEPLKKIRPMERGEETGTKVSFKPDADIFPDTTYDFDTLKTRLRELAFLNKGLHITLTDKRGEGRSEVYCYEGGLHVLRGISERKQGSRQPDGHYAGRRKEQGPRGHRHAVQRRLQRKYPDLRQRHLYGRRGHPPERLPFRPDPYDQRLRPYGRTAEGQGGKPVR